MGINLALKSASITLNVVTKFDVLGLESSGAFNCLELVTNLLLIGIILRLVAEISEWKADLCAIHPLILDFASLAVMLQRASVVWVLG
jgi:hypothetical protein